MDTRLKQLIRGKALFFIIVLGMGGSFQTGFHITVISSPSPYIQDFINASWVARHHEPPGPQTVTLIWSAIVSSYALGGLIGCLSIRKVSRKFGRKRAMMGNNLVSIAAAVVMWSSKSAGSFEMILIARFMYGFSAGLGFNIHAMYLGESSVKKLRGMMTMTVATFISFGKLSGQLAGLREFLGGEHLWNILLGFSTCFSAIQLVLLPFFPEAPRHLLIEKDNEEMCRKALQTLWGRGEFKSEIEEMKVEQAAIKGEQSKSFLGLLREKSVRWQLVTMLAILFGIQFSGVSAVSIFSFNIFQQAGIPLDKIRYVTLGIGMSEVLSSITCGLLIEKVGRRALLWGGFGAMSGTLALITLTLHMKEHSYWIPYSTVCLLFLFIMFFGGGPAGVFSSLNQEVFIQSCRPAAVSLLGAMKWVGFAVVGLVFPFLHALLKSLSFVMFACVCLSAALFVYLLVPETKDKTLLEISEEFKKLKIQACRPPLAEEVTMETRL